MTRLLTLTRERVTGVRKCSRTERNRGEGERERERETLGNRAICFNLPSFLFPETLSGPHSSGTIVSLFPPS